MLKATYLKRSLKFKQAGGTSRGVLYTKPSWFIKIEDADRGVGLGECSIIPNLSIDDSPDLEKKINEVCRNINRYQYNYHDTLAKYPSLRFALEMAFRGLENNNPHVLYASNFTRGEQAIVINGLIWMGDAEAMLQGIEQKLKQGFSCLKLKIGAIDFDQELQLLKHIRQRFSHHTLELRVDANGAFSPQEALRKLEALNTYHLHSIEQPIKAGQVDEMHQLCRKTPFPIALDEELIGHNSYEDKKALISSICPQYIILKPSLLGGWKASEEWVAIANEHNVEWWATSALEANVGLNAIAQWTYQMNNPLKQGLGTGQVFSNNIASPLYLKGEQLYYDFNTQWQDPFEDDGDE